MRRPLSVADDAAVMDEVDVGLVHAVRLDEREEVVVGVVRTRGCGQQPDPSGNALDVPIDRHERHVEGEEQQHGRRLLADAGDAREQSRASRGGSSARNSSEWSPRRSRIVRSADWMPFAFWFGSPPGRMTSTSSS